MSLDAILAALVLVILPALLFLGPLVLGLVGRRGGSRRGTGAGARSAGLPAMAYRVEQIAAAAVESIRAIATSFAAQVGVVYEARVQALGYLVARLRGTGGSRVAEVREGEGRLRHVVALAGAYELDVGLETQRPAGYRGAEVDLAPAAAGLRVDVTVDGEGFALTPGDCTTLEVRPAERVKLTFQLRPEAAGRRPLRIDVYHANAWAQSLDLDLEVRPSDELRLLARGDGGALAEAAEASLTLPPPAADAVPRDLHLSAAFAPGATAGATYRVRARRRGSEVWRRLEVPLREHDLQEINRGLREALDAVRDRFAEAPAAEGPDREARLAALDDLARRGHAAFLRLFPRAEDRDYLSGALGDAEPAHVEISTDSLFLPWELICDAYDPAAVDSQGFWGLRHHLTRVLTDVRQRESPTPRPAGPPKVNLYANPELPSVETEEAPYFRRLGGEGRILLCDWQVESGPGPADAPLRERRSRFLGHARDRGCDVAHFACHAIPSTYAPGSYLELADGLEVRIEDMEVERYRLSGAPLVVLNACGTGIRDPLKTSDFVRRFLLSGAKGVLATECDVPDRFAAAFAREVYDRILGGAPVVEALLAARRHFFDRDGNPLGLLYSAYLPLETRLVAGNG
jgi:hypothetical protein